MSTINNRHQDIYLSVNGVTKGINDTSKETLADGDIDNLSGTLDSLALLDQSIGTEEHDTDLAGFQVHAHALDTGGELDELLGLDIVHAVHTGDTVTRDRSSVSIIVVVEIH
jgi:hypothetical protein